MARKRLYDNDAEKQAAYRERKVEAWRAKVGPSNAEIAQAARDLHLAMKDTADMEGSVIAWNLLGANPQETLRNVQNFLCPVKFREL